MESKRILIAALGLCACLAGPSLARNGPITSNLKRALIYYRGYAGDHSNTPDWCGYLMKLGAQHGIEIDSTRNPDAFTPANLSKYQALVLFNAYHFGANMSQAQKDAVHDWYENNRGIACIHQCVKNSWGGTYPNWYDSLMGAHYKTFAGFGTGPVTVHPDVAGTDLAMNSDSTPVDAGTVMSWNDEWYTYDESPIGKANTKMLWTTKSSAHAFPFALPGDVQPVAWARETNGGRFVLNSLYHTSVTMETADPALKKFSDGALLGIMRWVAGYTGCTDPESPNYNPKATDNDPDICHAVPIDIETNGPRGNGPIDAKRLRVSFAGSGRHTLDVFDVRGRRVYFVRGHGPREYELGHLPPGMYEMKARSGRQSVRRSFLAL